MNGALETDTLDTIVFVAVSGARFLIPLAIPRFPLPALIAALVIDAADQTIFQQLSGGRNLEGYQGYDKALDVYYLTVAYVATLRNWGDPTAFEVGRFLWYYRLAGVVAFELTGLRALLLIFPNTFEYFFIFYESVRALWRPGRLGPRQLVLAAAAIWVAIKLPQEYWIHIAQLDVTDIVREHAWLWVVFGGVALLGLLAARVIVPRLPRPDYPLTFGVRARPLPERPIPTRSGLSRYINQDVLEKVVLVAMVSIIFGQIMPDLRATPLQMAGATAFLVVANAAVSQWLLRRGTSWASTLSQFVAMAGINAGLVVASAFLLQRSRGSLDVGVSLFFVLLLSLIVTLFDRYRAEGARGLPKLPRSRALARTHE